MAWELPNNVPFDAKKQLVKKFTCLWDGPVEACFDEVADRLFKHLNETIRKHFARFPKLMDYISCVCN